MPRLAQWLGRGEPELFGRSAFDLLAPESLASAQQAWGRRLAGISESLPCAFVGADGKRLEALVSAGPVLDDHGEVQGTMEIMAPLAPGGGPVGGVRVDLACRGILDSLADGVWLTDVRGTVVYTNAALRQMLSLPPAASGGSPSESDLLPDPLGRLGHVYRQARESLQPQAFTDIPVASRDGRSFFASGWMTPRLCGGRFDGMTCTIQDVTDAARETSVRAARVDHLERILSCLPLPVLVWNAGRRITQLNRAFEQASGYAAHELIGRDLGLLFSEDRRGAALARLTRLAPKAVDLALETWVQCRDGNERAFRWAVTPLQRPDAAGVVATVACVLHVSETPEAQTGFRECETGDRGLLDDLPVGIWWLRADGVTEHANAFVADLLGEPASSDVPVTFHDRVALTLTDLTARRRREAALEQSESSP